MKKLLISAIILLFATASYAEYQRGGADTRPPDFIKCKEATIVNYNIQEKEIIDIEGKPRTVYEYDYVEIEGEVTKAKFKEALEKKDKEKKDDKPWTPDEAVLEYEKEKIK